MNRAGPLAHRGDGGVEALEALALDPRAVPDGERVGQAPRR
jgi:hypothetical protein